MSHWHTSNATHAQTSQACINLALGRVLGPRKHTCSNCSCVCVCVGGCLSFSGTGINASPADPPLLAVLRGFPRLSRTVRIFTDFECFTTAISATIKSFCINNLSPSCQILQGQTQEGAKRNSFSPSTWSSQLGTNPVVFQLSNLSPVDKISTWSQPVSVNSNSPSFAIHTQDQKCSSCHTKPACHLPSKG